MLHIDKSVLSAFLTDAGKRHLGEDWPLKYSEDAVAKFGVSEREFFGRLTNAQAAHHAYEERLGKPDEHWADWYANHMLADA